MSRQQRRANQRRQQKEAKQLQKKLLSRSRAWIAAGAIAAYTALGANRPALAAAAADPANNGSPVATLPLKRFDIPAGRLDAALDIYAHAAGIALRIDIPHTQLSGFQTKGVRGLYRPEEAISILLEGTGLQSQLIPSTDSQQPPTIAIGLQNHETVNVTATLPDAVSMTKFTQPLVETPQSIVAVPQFVLHDEQNTTLKDALRNVPGISLAAGEFGAQGDNLTIRGFTARNDIFLDGIRDFGSYYRDSFDYEQVEVLEGPSGVQFGRGSTGGVINQESKVPQQQPFVNVQTQFGTDLTRRVSADINEPLTDLGPGSAFRANIVATEGGVAGRPYAANRHYGIAPSLSFGTDSPTRETFSYFHLTENDTPDYGLPWLYNGVAPANRHAYFGFPDSNYLRANVDILTGKFDHDFTPVVTLHSIGRWANYARDAQITEPQICTNASISQPVGGWVTALPTSSVTGQPCPYTLATPAAQIAVNRNELQVRSVEGDLWDQTDLTARLNLFGIRNDIDLGAEGGQEISNPVRTSYTINGLNTVPSTNLANPNPGQAVFGGQGYISSITHTKSDSVGIFFLDTLNLSRLFELSGGVRWDYFDTNYNLYAPPASVVGASLTAAIPPIEQIVHQPTYRAAFVFKPNTHGSVYFDWGTSFDPSAETLSLSVATSVLPPEENESYEAGAKYSLLHNRLMVDGAWFRTTQLNARETSPTNSNLIVEAGNQLVHGIQGSAVGHLSDGTDIVLGYAWLHSAVTASQFFPTSIGYPLANVPKQTFNAFLTRRLFAQIKAGLGGNYVAARTASSTVPYIPLTFGPAVSFAPGTAPCNTTATAIINCYQVLSVSGLKQVPGYWVFNAMVSRPISERIELQANIYNLLNRFYIDQPHPSHLIPGPGLSALIGANFRF
jgi:catecholate siderophore receptor